MASQESVKEILPAPVNVTVVVGAMPVPYPDVIDGEARLVTESCGVPMRYGSDTPVLVVESTAG